jgi:hypothetical protein
MRVDERVKEFQAHLESIKAVVIFLESPAGCDRGLAIC